MRGDLHHLFACEPGCNSFRGNIAYFDFADFEEAVRDDCGKPRDGTVRAGAGQGRRSRGPRCTSCCATPARSTTRDELPADRLTTLLDWHTAHPVERVRAAPQPAIFEKQGNRNPLIDHPDWAAATDFTHGLIPQVRCCRSVPGRRSAAVVPGLASRRAVITGWAVPDQTAGGQSLVGWRPGCCPARARQRSRGRNGWAG